MQIETHKGQELVKKSLGCTDGNFLVLRQGGLILDTCAHQGPTEAEDFYEVAQYTYKHAPSADVYNFTCAVGEGLPNLDDYNVEFFYFTTPQEMRDMLIRALIEHELTP